MNQYFNTNHKVEVTGYPYGRLRTTAFFGLDWKKGKGFRTTFQTINPKTNRLNAVKNSTYSPIMAMYKDSETGHIKYNSFNLNGVEEINRAALFLQLNIHIFTPEQIEEIYILFFTFMKVSIKAAVIYTGAKFEDLKPIFETSIDAAVKGIKTKDPQYFSSILIDVQKYEGTKDPNFRAFQSSEIVNLSTI